MRAAAEGLPLAFQIGVFVIGAMVGSFLNVVIARVPAGESIVSPGSRCPKCGVPIRWYDNVPVVSWLLLRAKCRSCGEPISARYPMVEALTGLLALAVVRRFGPTWTSVGTFAFVASLVALAYIDIDTWLLPHQITWPLIAVGLASPMWNRALPWSSSLIGAAAGFAFFAALALVGEKLLRRETMGWGDVWLLCGIGAWLGWEWLLAVVMLSALQGAVVGIVLIAAGRDPAQRDPAPPSGEVPDPADAAAPADEDWVPPRHAVPFGPFLALAALEVLFAGNWLSRLVGTYVFRS